MFLRIFVLNTLNIRKMATKEKKKYVKKCDYCSKEFKAARKSAKFCNTNCKQKNYLKLKEIKSLKEDEKFGEQLRNNYETLKILLEDEETLEDRLKFYEKAKKGFEENYHRYSTRIQKAMQGYLHLLLVNVFQGDHFKTWEYIFSKDKK